MNENLKENYSLMFTSYSDIVDIIQMREMLGGIGITLAYKLLKQRNIKSLKIGREYKIPKCCIIEYLLESKENRKMCEDSYITEYEDYICVDLDQNM